MTKLPLRAVAVALVAALSSCSDDPAPPTDAASVLEPGEICDADNRPELRLTFDPPAVVVAPGEARPVRLTIEPDLCEPNTATFTTDAASIADAPAEAGFDLRHATYDFWVRGGAPGRTTIRARMGSKDANGKPYTVDVALPVDVRDRAAPACAPGESAAGTLAAGAETLTGTGGLARAHLAVPPGAFVRQDELALPPFPAQMACAGDLAAGVTAARLRALGPAVSFTPSAPLSAARSLRREIEIALPVNPAAFPQAARMRHLLVLYEGPRAKAPRPIPVANPRIEPSGDDYVLKFSTPWFGTYQAAVEEDAGARTRKRRLTHRAVIGFSMGGGGAGVFGLRHHDQFDVVAPLGGPSDWTWLLWYIEQYALGGFCPAGQTCEKVAPNRYPMAEAFAHTQDFEHWYYEKGSGNGGSFPRRDYVQIFEDLALAMGNPNGSSSDPGLLHMALGPKKTDPWMVGDPAAAAQNGGDCSFTVEPIDGDPKRGAQREVEQRCRAARCAPENAWKAPTGYFDDEYNPDGSLQVISFCDGAQNGESPYVNTWAPGGDKPVNLALAVDLNGNGVRDQGEPVIRSGHEPYEDCGPDGLCDPDEPGYDPETNPDPNQDDYDYQLNPNGLEGNHRWDPGEPFKDYGLDGVPNTAALHVAGDPGEGDGEYIESPGLQNFYANDPHAMLARRSTAIPGGPITDDALRRIDILSDGGVRDLFNFASVANHLTGQIFGRAGRNGLPLRSVAFYNGFHFLPGQPQDQPNFFNPTNIRWADVADMPSVRYGEVDAPRALIEQGDGQHVGTAPQLLYRLETAFFYVGRRWPDADRRQTEESRERPAPGASECEVSGRCQFFFTSRRTKYQRTGPVAVSLPPGYAHEANVARDVRYPVLYVLHGYGQDPRDLEGVAVFTNNFMNVAERSYATRLPKFIIVYVDGRCRTGEDGRPECIRGTFYMESARPDGPPMDGWFDELVEHIDKTYRTMPPSEVEVAE